MLIVSKICKIKSRSPPEYFPLISFFLKIEHLKWKGKEDREIRDTEPTKNARQVSTKLDHKLGQKEPCIPPKRGIYTDRPTFIFIDRRAIRRSGRPTIQQGRRRRRRRRQKKAEEERRAPLVCDLGLTRDFLTRKAFFFVFLFPSPRLPPNPWDARSLFFPACAFLPFFSDLPPEAAATCWEKCSVTVRRLRQDQAQLFASSISRGGRETGRGEAAWWSTATRKK